MNTSICQPLSNKDEISHPFSLYSEKILHIRITSNSGGGYFSDESIALADIEGKSVNTPTFLMAALHNEEFIKPIGELKRYHQCIDAKSFKALIRKLQKLAISSTTSS